MVAHNRLLYTSTWHQDLGCCCSPARTGVLACSVKTLLTYRACYHCCRACGTRRTPPAITCRHLLPTSTCLLPVSAPLSLPSLTLPPHFLPLLWTWDMEGPACCGSCRLPLQCRPAHTACLPTTALTAPVAATAATTLGGPAGLGGLPVLLNSGRTGVPAWENYCAPTTCLFTSPLPAYCWEDLPATLGPPAYACHLGGPLPATSCHHSGTSREAETTLQGLPVHHCLQKAGGGTTPVQACLPTWEAAATSGTLCGREYTPPPPCLPPGCYYAAPA